MPNPARQELRVPGLDEPISHDTDAVRFGNTLLVSGTGRLAEDDTLGASPTDVSKVSTFVEVSALAIPGMKLEIEAVVGLPV